MSGSFHPVTNQIVVFTLDDQSYALSLHAVVKVIHAIEIRRLPKAPEIISGIINIKGQIIPVVDIRKCFGVVAREIDPDDHLIITDTGKRQVAIMVDSVTGISDLTPDQLSNAGDSLSFARNLRGVAKVYDGLILIYDLDAFLSLDEEKELDHALKIESK